MSTWVYIGIGFVVFWALATAAMAAWINSLLSKRKELEKSLKESEERVAQAAKFAEVLVKKTSESEAAAADWRKRYAVIHSELEKNISVLNAQRESIMQPMGPDDVAERLNKILLAGATNGKDPT